MKNSLLLGLIVAAVAAPLARAGDVQFNRDVRPILTDNCFHCHGPDPGTRKAGLRLDRKEGLFGKTDNGVAVVPGRPAESDLYQRLITDDEDDVMPPLKSHKTLPAAQKDLVKRWIEQGAPWQPHWSFIPPQRPELPKVKNTSWARNPIDAFILAKLETNDLAPAPLADKRALARRVSLDVTGLPPEPADLEAFLADQSTGAYENFVDHLLASPHYGEHRARYWLDAARYADTHGLHFDNYREMWPYRDWVINAFNRNQPFDQFTIEQLAGDLLPNRTLDQQIASGFHRCNVTSNEGGSITAELEANYAKDRVETTSAVWLGLTAQCSSCHDHKFDPVTMKEFYSFSAYFRNTVQPAFDGNVSDTPPIVVIPPTERRQRWDELTERSKALAAQLKGRRTESDAAFARWLEQGSGKGVTEPLDSDRQVFALDKPAGSVAGTENFDSDAPFSISARVQLPKGAGGVIFSKLDGASKEKIHGWKLEASAAGDLSATFIGDSPADRIVVRPRGLRLPRGKPSHVCLTYDGSRASSGVTIYLNGKAFGVDLADKSEIKGSLRSPAAVRFDTGSPRDARLFARALTADEVTILSKWDALRPLLAREPGKLQPAERADLALLYAVRFDAPYLVLAQGLATVESEMRQIRRISAITHVMQERPDTQPVAHVLYRGQYDQPREEVHPAIFASLHPLPKGAPANRLGLAEWIVSPENPLTARVTVNRLWQEIFGAGIVRTTEDFGIMGEPPSNQALLDWLAVEFQASGWDVKHMVRLMVTSAAYRQSPAVTPEKLTKDPANRWISRGPRFRMDAEMVRDTALAASGLLVPKIGGPSVRPYQPDGVWEAVAMPGSTTRDYKRDTGEGLYRRSLYTFWKRAAPPPSMDVFNAPSRENCTVRRERTDTPLQALVTLNDTQFVEAARHLAEIAIQEGSDSFDSRLGMMTARLLSRPFRPQEVQVARSAFADLIAHYKSHPDEAAQLLKVGDSKRDESIDPAIHAAWTLLANQLMNLDEALNK